jgi:hypothetical protein
MSRLLKQILTLSLVGAVLAAPAAAQSMKLGGGIVVPQGDYAADVETGWHAMGAFTFMPPASPVGFRADAAYHLSPFDLPGDIDASSAIITVSGDLVYAFSAGGASPYFLGGATWGNAQCTGDACPFETSLDAWGYNFGAGLDIGVFFAEARYVWLGGDVESSMVPITVGVHF